MKTTVKKPTAAQQAVIDRVREGYFPARILTNTVKGYVHVWLLLQEDNHIEEKPIYTVGDTFRAGEYKALCNVIRAGLVEDKWIVIEDGSDDDEIIVDWENSNCLYELHREGVREATRALNDY